MGLPSSSQLGWSTVKKMNRVTKVPLFPLLPRADGHACLKSRVEKRQEKKRDETENKEKEKGNGQAIE